MPESNRSYPIGKFIPKESYLSEELNVFVQQIESLPEKMEHVYRKLTAEQLDLPYRPGGWTARQVIHHLADSHMNAYIRFKWTLTEATPQIKAYNEKAWAETPETKADPQLSINLIRALHNKWALLLRSLSAADLQKQFIHPETNQQIPLERMIALYAWHGEHHLAHLRLILA